MAEPTSNHSTNQPADGPPAERRPFGAQMKRAGIAILFSAILLIPRIRRLRRKPRAWAAVRIVVFAAGAWLVRLFAHPEAGVDKLVAGIALMVFAILVRPRSETKSVDAAARELHALVVLNGGAFFAPGRAEPVPGSRIFVTSERLVVLASSGDPAAIIPVAQLRRVAACSASPDTAKSSETAWDLEITWQAAEFRSARCRYAGFFAEHLARIAQQTIESVWKTGLRVLKP